jgi:serine protease inhibitor
MIAAYNALGQATFLNLARSAGNVVISPLSIGMTLTMALVAAAGKTAEEMVSALKFGAAPPELFEANADLLRRYRESGVTETLRLRLANALVLTRHGEAVAKSYRNLLADSFEAEIFEGDAARVNRWVAEKTEGKIERVLDGLPPDDIAVLVNAIYFKALWEKPFSPASTYGGRFLLSEDEEIEVKMMNAIGDYAVAGGKGYRAARLPYKTPSLSMIIVLPNEIEGLDACLGAFDLEELTRLRAEMNRVPLNYITLELPRFRASFEASLRPALQGLGIRLAFDWTRADFSGMTGRAPKEIPVAISDVRHCALIEVAEEGTEAAGATMKLFHIGGSSPSFLVDRPFLFFIVDETAGAVLFQGRITDPR